MPDTKLICSKEATEQAPRKLWLKVEVENSYSTLNILVNRGLH